jgi:hypothetical protein
LGYYWDGGSNISSPQRLIANLERFRELYGEADLRGRSLPSWYHYSLGLAYQELGSHRAALGHMRLALAGGLPMLRIAKALGTVAWSSLQAIARDDATG